MSSDISSTIEPPSSLGLNSHAPTWCGDSATSSTAMPFTLGLSKLGQADMIRKRFQYPFAVCDQHDTYARLDQTGQLVDILPLQVRMQMRLRLLNNQQVSWLYKETQVEHDRSDFRHHRGSANKWESSFPICRLIGERRVSGLRSEQPNDACEQILFKAVGQPVCRAPFELTDTDQTVQEVSKRSQHRRRTSRRPRSRGCRLTNQGADHQLVHMHYPGTIRWEIVGVPDEWPDQGLKQ